MTDVTNTARAIAPIAMAAATAAGRDVSQLATDYAKHSAKVMEDENDSAA